MKITILIFSSKITDESHPFYGCDTELCDASGLLVGYAGGIWGEIPRPEMPELLDYHICDVGGFEDFIASKGWAKKIVDLAFTHQ